MNNIKNAIYVISKLDFNDLAVGAKPSTIKDNNSGVGLQWTVSAPNDGEIKEVSGVKILNFKTNNYKLSTTISGADLKNGSIQFEADILIPSVKADNIFFNVGNSTSTGFRFNIKNTFRRGLEVIFGTSRVAFNFLFESNKKYNIVVSKDYNVYSLYVDGMIIGHCVSNDFNNLININTTPSITLGASANTTTNTVDQFIGEISNVNISFGGDSNKYSNSFTKYGDNLISRLNFGNLAYASSATVFTPGLEAVRDSKMTWVYGDVTASGEYGNLDGTPFTSNIGDVSTVYFTMNTGKNVSDIDLVNFNDLYKIVYTYNVEGEPEPEVVVNEYTTSALDFENGLVDKVGTTVWTKEGTADITANNKLFGEHSFETKELGDSLYTTNAVITGGATPFTIEFYALIKGHMFGAGLNDSTAMYPLLSDNTNDGNMVDQFIALSSNKQAVMYRGSGVTNSFGDALGIQPQTIQFNEVNKYTITYDSSALRFFINDRLNSIVGTKSGFENQSKPFTFLNNFVDAAPLYRTGTAGIIDTINIHDGIATKVRDPDPYEEYLVVDLAFDGENNSTKIVDNGTDKSQWELTTFSTGEVRYSGCKIIKNDSIFKSGFSYVNKPAVNSEYLRTFSNSLNFGSEDFTIEFEFIKTNDTPLYTSILSTYCTNYNESVTNKALFNISCMGGQYTVPHIRNRVFFFNEYEMTRVDIPSLQNTSSYEQVSKIDNSVCSKTVISLNVPYKVTILRKENELKLYINDILECTNRATREFNLCDVYGFAILGNAFTDVVSLIGRINYFKAYRGVAVIPEDPTGKIQLDFDNSVIDKYSNSTWTNNGVTFDQVNSVKGYSAYFDNPSSDYLETNSSDLNFLNNNFKIGFDVKNDSFGPGGEILTANSTSDSSNSNMFYIYCNNSSGVGLGVFTNNDNSISNGSLRTYENNWYNFNYYRINNLIVSETNGVIHHIRNLNFNLNINNTGFRLGKPHSTFGNFLGFDGYLDNFKSYKENLLADNMKIYSDPSVNISYEVSNESMYVYGTGTISNTNGSSIVHLLDSPILKDFIAEVELYFDSSTPYIYGGLIFRTTTYAIRTPQMGYLVYLTTTTNKTYLRFGKGTNSTTDSWTAIHSVDVDSYRNGTYRVLKVVANNSTISAYIDNNLIFTVDDSTHNNSSNFGLNVMNYFNTAVTSRTKRIDIYNINGVHLYHKDWKSKIENKIDRPAVHLPLETNAINTGFTPLTINRAGSPTYTTVDGKKCIKFGSGNYLTINSNNIFNLGTSSDFYIEFDFYPIKNRNGILSNKSGWVAGTSYILHDTTIGFEYWNGSNSFWLRSTNALTLNAWNNVIIHRKAGVLSIVVNDSTPDTMTFEYPLNFNLGNAGTTIGTYGTDSGSAQNVNTGYMSNFKMFVGTSEIPETYNDKKVLDLDFKPTGKSYLFKDNNNKCIIHPVNITQRDYQDSQYCCTFNGTDQYLQLGKNDLLNFGLDDFVINIKFKISNLSKMYNQIFSAGGTTTGRPYIAILGSTHEIYPTKLALSVSGGQVIFVSNNSFEENIIYDIKFIRKDDTLSLYINDVLDSSITSWHAIPNNLIKDLSLNFNLNSQTVIARVMSNETEYFNGTIYSIKVLRNTTDLSLLDEETIVYASDEKFTLTNGVEAETIEFTDIKERDVKIVTDTDKVFLRVDDTEVNVPKTSTIDNIELFKDYTSQIKDVRVYDIPLLQDDDEFVGSVLIDTQYPELEVIDDGEELQVIDVGNFVIKGFIEGGVGRNYIIRNKVENFELIEGIDDYFYDGIDERYFDNYEIYEVESKQSYPLPKHVMEKGVISGIVDTGECKGASGKIKPSDMTAWCYNNGTQRLIGSYPVSVDGTYLIPNIDVHTRYDIVFKHNNRLIENISSSYRKPKRVEYAKNPQIIGIDYEYNQNSSFIKYTWNYSMNVTFSSVKLHITENPIIDNTTPFIELGNNINHYNDYNVIHNHQYYATIVATYEGNEYRSTQLLVNTHDRTPTVITSVEFNKNTGNVLITW